MSGTLSKYFLEDDDVRCEYPDAGHCPIKCMSRNYAPLYLRFEHLEQSMREVKKTLDMVLEYVSRGIDSDSEADKTPKKKAKTESCHASPTESEKMNMELMAAQAALEKDFSQLLTWRDSDDEGGKPKKPKRCMPRVKTESVSSNDGDSSEGENDDQGVSAAGDIMIEVIEVMAKGTAGIAEQVAADADEQAQKVADNDDSDEGNVEDEGDENEDGDESEPEFVGDFLAMYNEMNEVD